MRHRPGGALIGPIPRSRLGQAIGDRHPANRRVGHRPGHDQHRLAGAVLGRAARGHAPDRLDRGRHHRQHGGEGQGRRRLTCGRYSPNFDLDPRRLILAWQFAQGRGGQGHGVAGQVRQGQPGRLFADLRLYAPPHGEGRHRRTLPRRQAEAGAHAVGRDLDPQQRRPGRILQPIQAQPGLKLRDRPRLPRHQQGRDIANPGQIGGQALAGLQPQDFDVLRHLLYRTEGDHVPPSRRQFGRSHVDEDDLARLHRAVHGRIDHRDTGQQLIDQP